MNEKSKDQKAAAAEVLAKGGTHKRAAEKAGCSVRTIQTWVRDPDFIREFFAPEQEAVTQTRATALPPLVVKLTDAIGYAIDTVVGTLTDESPAARNNLTALVDNLKKMIDLERADIAPHAAANIKAGALNAKPRDAVRAAPSQFNYDEVGRDLVGAATAPPKSVRDAKEEEDAS
jgi:hypothetical protein